MCFSHWYWIVLFDWWLSLLRYLKKKSKKCGKAIRTEKTAESRCNKHFKQFIRVLWKAETWMGALFSIAGIYTSLFTIVSNFWFKKRALLHLEFLLYTFFTRCCYCFIHMFSIPLVFYEIVIFPHKSFFPPKSSTLPVSTIK